MAFEKANWAPSRPSLKRRSDAYERSSKAPYPEVYMDLHNNRVGRRIGAANKDASREQIFDLVAGELDKRRLITHPTGTKTMIKRSTLLRIAMYTLGLFLLVSLLAVFMLSNLLSRKVIVHVENGSSNAIAVEVVLWEPNVRDYGDEPVRHMLRFDLEPGEALQRLLLPPYGGGSISTTVRDGPNEYQDYGQYLLGMRSFFYLENYTVVYEGAGVIKIRPPKI
ncbi:DUF6973 domain-containing protein [Sinorhizobium meliloti]|uniref:DUF6973 domain-containing protein n=2 Tax=Rhizobium meliloti TaxID=382 RepID=UPI001F42CC93|nr:hypothetical protein [Sinorhizobium meliloti]